MKSIFFTGSLLSCLFFISGCGDGVATVPLHQLSGTVNFDGKPVKYGRVEFTPEASEAELNPTGYADIVDGKYDTAQAGGKGVVGGPHQIRFTAYEDVPQPGNEDETVEQTNTTPPLFVGYLIQQDLPKETTTVNFEIPAQAKGFNMYEAGKKALRNQP